MNHPRLLNSKNALKTLNLMAVAPSIFTDEPASGMSNRYEHVSTMKIVDALCREGWTPSFAVEKRSRLAGRIGYQKHMIRFRRGTPERVGDTIPELLLTNSHDGSTSFKIQGGLFRLVCGNGLVIADRTFGQVRMRHVGFDAAYALAVAEDFSGRLPQIGLMVDAMQSRVLTPAERTRLAVRAIRLRWPGRRGFRIRPRQLLKERRRDDSGSNLWLSYNVIQENLMRGGLETNLKNEKSRTSRPVRSIDETIRLNTGLWELASAMI